MTAAQTAFLSVPLIVVGNTTEYVANGSVTGDLGKYGVKLPSADQGLQMNVGAEWREETTNYLPDFLDQQGSAAGSGGAVSPINGGFTVREAFTEVRLPLASHVAGADDLAFEGGYRYSKYSLGFNTNTYKLGLEWAPVRDARFRGSFQRAVRAPNIGELFTPQAVGLDGAHDPCAALANATTCQGTTPAQCALTGVTPAQYGHIVPNAALQYNGLFGGNPNLKPEVADTYTVGLVLQPRMVPNLTLSFDYFDIKIKNVIGAVGGNTIIKTASRAGVVCNAVHRDATARCGGPTTGTSSIPP